MSRQFLTKSQFRFPCVTCTSLTSMLGVVALLLAPSVYAQRRTAPGGGQRAVVVDERLAVLRNEPGFSAHVLKRLSRGREVSIMSTKRSPEGTSFYRVAVTRRTRGWIQREAVVSQARKGDDERLQALIVASKDFDRIARASIFLSTYPRSTLRPSVLLLLGAAADDAARKLSSDATRRLDEAEMKANNAAESSYFLNFSGLDRYRRIEVDFVFDVATRKYRYDGKSWREIVRRYPRSQEAVEARRHLELLAGE